MAGAKLYRARENDSLYNVKEENEEKGRGGV